MSIKRSKNQLRREKAKQRKIESKDVGEDVGKDVGKDAKDIEKETGLQNGDEIKNNQDAMPEKDSKEEPVVDQEPTINLDTNSELFKQYKSILNKFKPKEQPQQQPQQQLPKSSSKRDKIQVFNQSDTSSSESEPEESEPKLSKRQLRKISKPPLSKLKLSTNYPEIVDWSDADSKDPYLLISIKSHPNIIQVPSHWNSKKDYLSSRKGFDKMPFQLPSFIKETGIEEMRQVNDRSLRQSQREKTQVRMGKLDIDYEKLYNAFFRNQFISRPRLFPFGELYEEGKEISDSLNKVVAGIRPGVLSSKLRKALGMPENDQSIAPAWITIMKEIGKPPAYENLIIPGIDCDYKNSGYIDKDNDVNKSDFVYFGKINNLVESESESESESEEEEEEEDESENEKEEEEEVKEEVEEVNELKEEVEEVKEEVKEKSTFEILSELPAEPKNLYKVLKENKNDDLSITGHSYQSDFEF
ncbi:unnamed protein product [Candida verbasci]|uniref:PSP proline-rich domain-containing protein n=1 Tax=Candida verbasci TaxID=1227364 RepID=A0A9W4X8N0_9ASCO|nr:unnamed protein product [Candida verbasci]